MLADHSELPAAQDDPLSILHILAVVTPLLMRHGHEEQASPQDSSRLRLTDCKAR